MKLWRLIDILLKIDVLTLNNEVIPVKLQKELEDEIFKLNKYLKKYNYERIVKNGPKR